MSELENNPAVVAPLDEHMGLDIARSLGQYGIRTYGIDPDRTAAGRSSKYCTLVVSPDPKDSEADYVNFLIDWGKQQKKKPVLFPVSDHTVLVCSRERERLLPYYEFVMPDHATIARISSKHGLASAAAEFDIPAPLTISPQNLAEVKAAAPGLDYPVILKPVESEYWHTEQIVRLLRKNALSGRLKVVMCRDAQELVQTYQRIAAYDPRMIIQEPIPGPDENLFYISFYLDRNSRPLAVFSGRKYRVFPVGFGSASYVRSCYDPELEQVALKFLAGIRYQGLGGLEFKKDLRDGRYKLIEFNPRFGMWDGLGTRCGINTAYIAYQDALGRPVDAPHAFRDGIIWVDWQRDVRAFWKYRQQGSLSLQQWMQSLRGEKMSAIYSKDDWRPGITYSANLLLALLGRLTRRKSA